MEWYYDNRGELTYVSFGNGDDPRSLRDSVFYLEPAPFRPLRPPPFYINDVEEHHRSFRDQHLGRGELLPVVREQLGIRREDPDRHPTTGPWWHNPDHPHNGRCSGWVEDRHHEENGDEEDESTVLEFHAPQLYSDQRQTRVEDALRQCPGVVNVVADQWQRKVVVKGNRLLREDHVLRLLRSVPGMERSDLWRNLIVEADN